jgi:hypothetical protein
MKKILLMCWAILLGDFREEERTSQLISLLQKLFSIFLRGTLERRRKREQKRGKLDSYH